MRGGVCHHALYFYFNKIYIFIMEASTTVNKMLAGLILGTQNLTKEKHQNT